ncbi:M28 family peptidase [Spongiivirga sp. MCCC 1A20706]|uniref:M28 family peptidase n=1 Tax=Spongiivirga sp. MCCC 1A20706 TaxID=3160963 RepID=UPI003977CE80
MKNFSHKLSFLLIAALAYYSFKGIMPSSYSKSDAPLEQFSTERALIQISQIAQEPHYGSTKAHTKVREYITVELEKLGLKVDIQEGYSLTQWNNMAKVKNIIARIKGSDSSKALLLLSHYDSNPHSAIGASDAASGVATILEGVRAYLTNNKPKNDIIILITDGEELGLSGADVFVNQHPWAKDVGLVLNFEARGSGGPSFMFAETNGGNANLIKGFKKANPDFPVSNSLLYSIYKLLPNDTDLTVFREDGNIDGFNFAFIDDHYDYHTANDNYANLDRTTLEHQGSYIMPLLSYFANADLSTIKSENDHVFFNFPIFKIISYPFTLVYPMLLIGLVIFGWLIVYGMRTKRLQVNEIFKGFIPFLILLLASGLVGYFLWPLLKLMYPDYREILHGFTYNGHWYIAFAAFLVVGMAFLLYHKFSKPVLTVSHFIAPITFWLIINILVALYLRGASFFIIPVYFALFGLFVCIRQKKPNLLSMTLLCAPAIIMFAPFIEMFPVGLGLAMLVTCTTFTALLFSLILPVFGFYNRKKLLGYGFLIIALGCFITAHFKSGFNDKRQKPNSLLYVYNADTNSANWLTYDEKLDNWTRPFLNEDVEKVEGTDIMYSKYGTDFTYSKKAENKALRTPVIDIALDTIIGNERKISLCISPQRFVDRFEFFADRQFNFNSFVINGVIKDKKENESYVFGSRRSSRLFAFFMNDQEPLNLEFSFPKDEKPSLQFYESSFDLLTNELFNVPERSQDMIPKPFVLNDAVVVKKELRF